MARHDSDERSRHDGGAARLAGLGLVPPTTGWVPDPPATGPADDAVTGPAPPPEPVDHLLPTSSDLIRGWAKDRLPPWLHALVDRATLGSILTGAAATVAALVAIVMMLHRHPGPAYPSTYSSSSASRSPSQSGSAAATSPGPVASSATSIVIDVGGRVRKPGLVTLPAGARVADAIAAAGGPLHHRELAATNLAARVSDGQLLLIGVSANVLAGASPTGTSPDAPSSPAPVALNAATLEQLETLPGIGPVTGQKIIDWRTAHSGFTAIEQLQQVSGIGPATYAELAPLVTL